jgi:hypothetical protein
VVARSTAVGVFEFSDEAQRAIEALREAGFSSGDIGITMRDMKEAQAIAEDGGVSAGAGAATGALAGGALGGLAGWLVGIGALAIPGIGPIVAAGPLAAALTGAALGAAGGGLLGALTGMGVPEEEARWYEAEVGRGGTLVTVRANGRYEEARRILHEHGAREAGTLGSDPDAGRPERSTEAPIGATPDSIAGVAAGGARSAPAQGTGNWADVLPEFRSEWQARHGTSGRSWEQDEPAYRYGWESAADPRYQGHEWGDVEGELGRDWSSRYSTGTGHGGWEDARVNVRQAWDRARRR